LRAAELVCAVAWCATTVAFGCASQAPPQAPPDQEPRPPTSYLANHFELDEKHGTFRLTPHRDSYFMPGRYSDDPNESPESPAHPSKNTFDYRNVEAEFQFSIKSKLWEDALSDRVDLWFGYTQLSQWQVYAVSAPLRESDYEPELFATIRTDWDVGPLHWRMVNVGFVHQSNGGGPDLSRSWNRLYAQFGLERGAFSLLFRPWYRIPDSEANDDNPDISGYLGYGDLVARYEAAGHVVTALFRDNLRTGDNRGAVELDWAIPCFETKRAKILVQLFSGYGESLIDYNHAQNSIGIGFVLTDWD
jgi:phospholipase A1